MHIPKYTYTRSYAHTFMEDEVHKHSCTRKVEFTEIPYAEKTAAHKMLFVGCLTSQQHTVVYLRVSDICRCCHTEKEIADNIFYLIQSEYTDTGSTSPRADPRTPGAGGVATGIC